MEVCYTTKGVLCAPKTLKKGKEQQMNNGQQSDKIPSVQSAKKRSAKKLPMRVKIYRAVYTFFYVASQLVKECALFLYKKIEPAVIDFLSFLYGKWTEWQGERKRRRQQEQDVAAQAEEEQNKETVVFGKTVKKAPSAAEQSKKRGYVEEDFLDFDEEDQKRGRKRKKKGKKEKNKRPSFEEFLRRKEERDARRSHRGKRFLVGVLVGVLSLQLLSGLFAAGLYLYLGNDIRLSGVDLYFRQGKELETHSVSARYAYGENGAPRVNMTALAAWLEIETVSDRKMIYYTLHDGSRMVLMQNSRNAVINGAQITLSEKVIVSGGQVYAPLELLSDYTDGLCINYSEKEDRLTFRRYIDPELHTERNPVYKELTLTVCAIESAPLPQVNEPIPSRDPN